MTKPHIAFLCELEPEPLRMLIADTAVIDDLRALEASVHLGLLDLNPERAAAVRVLNQAGIPVVAWLLLPKAEGYWFNLYNAQDASRCYARFAGWAREAGLCFAGVGVDIEPAYDEMQQLLSPERWRLLPTLFGRAFGGEQVRRGQSSYASLVAQMRADGYPVTSYQIPLIADERRVGSRLLQRLFGVVDVRADREVLMLYSSFFRGWGAGLLWSYAPDAGGIGIGSTGGGVEAGRHLPVLTWDGLVRDLRLARQWTDEVVIFSLEGCVRQGLLRRLRAFDWAGPVDVPAESAFRVEGARRALRATLWAANRPGPILGFLALAGLIGRWRLRSAWRRG